MISSCCSCAYVEILSTWEVWRALKRLDSRDSRVAFGCALCNSYASFVLSKHPACSISRHTHADAWTNCQLGTQAKTNQQQWWHQNKEQSGTCTCKLTWRCTCTHTRVHGLFVHHVLVYWIHALPFLFSIVHVWWSYEHMKIIKRTAD